MTFTRTVQITKRLAAAAALIALLLAGSGLLPVPAQGEVVALYGESSTNDSMRDLPWIVVPNGNFWSG